MQTIAHLRIGQRAKIVNFDLENIPLKLIEMGCLPGNEVELLAVAPLGCPLFLNMNESQLSIRVELAKLIEVEILNPTPTV